MSDIKQKLETGLVAVAIIGFVIAMSLGLILEVKRSIRMKVYATSHDCSWVYYGDIPGNDQGYICK